jgi:hypothetical protein
MPAPRLKHAGTSFAGTTQEKLPHYRGLQSFEGAV